MLKINMDDNRSENVPEDAAAVVADTEPMLSPTVNSTLCSENPKVVVVQPTQIHNLNVPMLSHSLLTDDESEHSSPSSSDEALSLPGIKISYDLTPFSSTLSSLHPVCRICQNPAEKNNALLTPCRCDGSLKYVHGTCLRHWIEVRLRRKKYQYPRNCELCGYLYRKRKYIKCREWKMRRISTRDKILHSIFILCIIAMVSSAVVTIQHLIYDSSNGGAHKYKVTEEEKASLTVTELITLTCGVVFFVTFMIAVTVEIKARHTIYDIFRNVIRHNTVWVIENYNRKLDTSLMRN
ncbi:E3 ubiquitin-protein ligase MARCHF8-like [Watersipora subatra]|uniref:E3 ubiquitin-protein ligase MARCHF8-like n=1 Tax=Watersipora subatra TaxID=2589382 RepID=UPI00355BC452